MRFQLEKKVQYVDQEQYLIISASASDPLETKTYNTSSSTDMQNRAVRSDRVGKGGVESRLSG